MHYFPFTTTEIPRWVKIITNILITLVIILILLLIGVAIYIHQNKASLLKQITAKVNENLNGTISVEGLETNLIQGFPGVSLSLKNVTLRDSLYPVHKHTLLQVENVFVAFDVFSVLKGSPRISNVRVRSGKIYLFTDSTGYSNTSVFKKKEKAKSKDDENLRIQHLFLNDVEVVYENINKFKLHSLDIDEMEALLHYNDTGLTARVDVEAVVKSLAFNTTKGSFIKDKKLDIDIDINYNSSKKILSVARQRIKVGKDKVYLGGTFFFAEMPAGFIMDIEATDILLQNAKALLSPAIAVKLNIIDLKKPVDIYARLQGHLKYLDTPDVHLKWVVKDNVLTTPIGAITDCSFTGMYMNQMVPGQGHEDKNSKINLYGLNGSWKDIDFKADTLNVSNLVRPIIEGQFQSIFSLTKLNPVIGGNSFLFDGGEAKLNLLYKGGIMPDDPTSPYVFGSVQVINGAMTYLPRHLSFSNTNALIRFEGADVFIKNVNVKNGGTVLQMDGSIRNFLNLYYTDPTKILFDWNIRSAKIDLEEYRAFLAPRGSEIVTAEKRAAKKSKNAAVPGKLDKMLDASSVQMKVQVGNVIYKNFTANNFRADIYMGQSGLVMKDISLNHAGGRVEVKGNIDQKGPINDFHIVSNIQNVHIQQFFKSFDNFGQDAITDKNLRGNLFANIDMSGSIRANGTILPKSFAGTVDFDVQEGALVNFEPFRKIGKYIFRKRNLENVTFRNLKNRLEIKGDKFTINPMLLETSAINMHIRGVYSLSTGTDIDIDVPLRNPKKDELIIDDDLNMERSMKGIVIHLKAVDGDDSNVKIKLVKKKQQDVEKE